MASQQCLTNCVFASTLSRENGTAKGMILFLRFLFYRQMKGLVELTWAPTLAGGRRQSTARLVSFRKIYSKELWRGRTPCYPRESKGLAVRKIWDTAIVGGPAGLVAGISAAQRGSSLAPRSRAAAGRNLHPDADIAD